MKYLDNYIKRTTSCLTDSNKFEDLAIISNFPVFFGATDTKEEDDLYAKMTWCIEPETGLIQLNNLIPLEILYQSQHAFGFGSTWENHYQEFSKFIMSHKPINVLEIGGGQGRIAQICSENELLKSWTILEPNPTFNPTSKIKIINGFFDMNFNILDEYDTYTFSHVLEHAYNPKEFLLNIYNKIKVNENLIFSYPNLKVWLSKNFTNSLNFEHTIFLTDTHLDTLLNNIGFEIIKKVNYIDHSHFYFVKKLNNKIIYKEFENLYSENKKLLLDFINYHYQEVNSLNSLLDEYKENKIFIFGGHIFSQYLKVFGLKTEKIECILDNSKEKEGKRLYGTNQIIYNPIKLKNLIKPVIILRAGPYNDEIKNQILNEINSSTIFI